MYNSFHHFELSGPPSPQSSALSRELVIGQWCKWILWFNCFITWRDQPLRQTLKMCFISITMTKRASMFTENWTWPKIVPHYIPHSGVCQFGVFKQKYGHSDSVSNANFALSTSIVKTGGNELMFSGTAIMASCIGIYISVIKQDIILKGTHCLIVDIFW